MTDHHDYYAAEFDDDDARYWLDCDDDDDDDDARYWLDCDDDDDDDDARYWLDCDDDYDDARYWFDCDDDDDDWSAMFYDEDYIGDYSSSVYELSNWKLITSNDFPLQARLSVLRGRLLLPVYWRIRKLYYRVIGKPDPDIPF